MTGPEDTSRARREVPDDATTSPGVATTGAAPVDAAGGWRGQSMWLKVMLAVSLVFVAMGVYRCSSELTPPAGPGTVAVESAAVDVPDSLAGVPSDSLSALTTRLFARGLRDVSDATVVVGRDPSAWAIVRLRLEALPDGSLNISSMARSTVGGRVMAASTVSGSRHELREMTAEAALLLVEELQLSGGDASAVPEDR